MTTLSLLAIGFSFGSASVLSIGLSVGFTTQSNFYAAFKDIVGMPPGQYRKQQK